MILAMATHLALTKTPTPVWDTHGFPRPSNAGFSSPTGRRGEIEFADDETLGSALERRD